VPCGIWTLGYQDVSPPILQRASFLPLLSPRSASLPASPPAAPSGFSSDGFLARWLDNGEASLGLAAKLQEHRADSLRAAIHLLGSSQRTALEARLGTSTLEEIFSLAAEQDPAMFFEGVFGFANAQAQKGRVQDAASIYTAMLAIPSGQVGGLAPDLRSRVQGKLDVLLGRGNFGNRAEGFLRSSVSLEGIAGGVSQTGALLGLATIACSFIRPLRPLAAGGVQLLSHPTVSATLLASGGYLLVRSAPEAWAAGDRLISGNYRDSRRSLSEDGLFLSGWFLGALGIGVGAASFGMGARSFTAARQAALAEGFSGSEASAVAYIRADAVRRAVQDPEIWTQYARSATNLNSWQRLLLGEAGRWTSRGLLYGSAGVGVGKFAFGLSHYLNQSSPSAGASNSPGLASLFLGLAMDVSPAATVHLYRAGRGNRDFNLGPALSQELTERHYQDPGLRSLVLERLDRGVGPMAPALERAFIRQANRDLLYVARALRRANALTPLSVRGPRNLGEVQEIFASNLAQLPTAPAPVRFSAEARFLSSAERLDFAGLNLSEIRSAYSEGQISPVAAVIALMEHPDARNGAIFPHSIDSGPYRSFMLRRAEQSHARFERGEARPLEGVLVGVKDLFLGADGQMYLGSKTARVSGVETSPLMSTLLELGAIPVPLGMVAGANGGSGRDTAFGYVPHPSRPGFDPAGSSNASAYAVGRHDLPIAIAIGTDTGGSVSAPAGAVGLVGFVPPAGMISTKNMVPFATFLDRVGVLARDPADALSLARMLSRVAGSDPHQRLQNPGAMFEASPARPRIAYLESLVAQASPEARVNFLRKVEEYRQQGFEVQSLGSEWDFVAQAPMRLYPFDAYVPEAFTHTNPLQRNRFDPPRRTLDDNLRVRLPKAALSLRLGFYDEARSLSQQYQDLLRNKVGEGVVLVSPATEAIRTEELLAGRAGTLLDGHDLITMAKNRMPEWGQVTLPSAEMPHVGLSLSGALPDLMHFTGEVRPILRRMPEAPRRLRPLPLFPMYPQPAFGLDAPAAARVARVASSPHESL